MTGVLDADRQVCLQAHSTRPSPKIVIATRKQQGEPGRNREFGFAASDQLIPVVKTRITPSRARTGKVACVRPGQGNADLMFQRTKRPFVGQGIHPIMTVREYLERTYVLNDSVFLVVRFFNEETVVLYGSRCVPSDSYGILSEH
jgi:hypothetical protein